MKPRNIALVGIFSIAVIGGAAFIMLNGDTESSTTVESRPQNDTPSAISKTQEPTNQAPNDLTPKQELPTNPTPPATGIFSGEQDLGTSPDIAVFEVTFDGQNFSPSSIEIKTGDIIFFTNNSETDFWPISSSNSYSEFNAGKAFGPGETFDFKFIKAGTWSYYDKLNPEASGSVVVKS